jgi:hypothetical protein
MAPRTSLPCSLELATVCYSNPDASNPHTFPASFLKTLSAENTVLEVYVTSIEYTLIFNLMPLFDKELVKTFSSIRVSCR